MDTVANSGNIAAAEVLIDDEDFRLSAEDGFVVARDVSQSAFSLLGNICGHIMVICILYLLVIAGWWLKSTYFHSGKRGEILLDSDMALKALVVGVAVILFFFTMSLILFRLDRMRRKARAALYNWKFESATGWFYDSEGLPLVAAKDAQIELVSELAGRSLFRYQFYLLKNERKILLFESVRFKAVVKFISLLIEWGFPNVGNWEKRVREIERI